MGQDGIHFIKKEDDLPLFFLEDDIFQKGEKPLRRGELCMRCPPLEHIRFEL